MTELQVNCISPFDLRKPHFPQQKFLSLDLQGESLRKVHFVSGRGGGKTLASVLLALNVCLDEPGTRGCVLSPTVGLLRDVFLKTWEDIVPEELYTLRRSDMTIELINGSFIFLRSRYVDNPTRGRSAHRGLDINWVIDDEAALKFDKTLTSNVMACCRRKGRYSFYACCTTPRIGVYKNYATSPGHTVIYSSTRDNPHLPKNYADDLAAEMSPQQAKREIDGQWVALEGLVWDTFSDEPWPKGNMHEHRFSPGSPWYLWLDLGVGNGAYLVVQPVRAGWGSDSIFRDPVWVVVGELTPLKDGSARRAFERIKTHFGSPVGIVAGADMNTRSNSAGDTPMYFANQIFPGVPVYPITGWHADKMVQYDSASYAMCSTVGERRLCVSNHLVSLDSKAERGILQLFAEDSWPENAGKIRGQYLNKEGRLEHVRDALLYGAVHTWEPSYGADRPGG